MKASNSQRKLYQFKKNSRLLSEIQRKKSHTLISKKKDKWQKAISSLYYNKPLLHNSGFQYFKEVRELHTMENNFAFTFLDSNKFELAGFPASVQDRLIGYMLTPQNKHNQASLTVSSCSQS